MSVAAGLCLCLGVSDRSIVLAFGLRLYTRNRFEWRGCIDFCFLIE